MRRIWHFSAYDWCSDDTYPQTLTVSQTLPWWLFGVLQYSTNCVGDFFQRIPDLKPKIHSLNPRKFHLISTSQSRVRVLTLLNYFNTLPLESLPSLCEGNLNRKIFKIHKITLIDVQCPEMRKVMFTELHREIVSLVFLVLVYRLFLSVTRPRVTPRYRSWHRPGRNWTSVHAARSRSRSPVKLPTWQNYHIHTNLTNFLHTLAFMNYSALGTHVGGKISSIFVVLLWFTRFFLFFFLSNL